MARRRDPKGRPSKETPLAGKNKKRKAQPQQNSSGEESHDGKMRKFLPC